jgi:predicted nucleotidyltransferase
MTLPTLIFETLHGSRAYNLHRKDSDVDLKGIIVGPPSWYFGFRGGPEQTVLTDDHVQFEIRKFFRLGVAANPTVFEMLWAAPDAHQTVTSSGERLIDAREYFLTKRVEGTFAGYTLSQLKRIKTHRQWLLHPPPHPPKRNEFGLPERTLIPKEQLGAAEALIEQGRMEEAELTPNFLAILEREKQYRHAKQSWDAYLSWKQTRNEKRSALEHKFGYDTKHAMHLVRLQRMAVEILEHGKVIVYRPDREELLAIRDGALSYDELIEQCEARAEAIHIAAMKSSLPDAPDEEALDELCMAVVKETLKC